MSFTQGRIEKPIIQTDADEGQADYPFSAPIRREDVEGADVNDDDAMEVEQNEDPSDQPVSIRVDALHLVGVDDLSTEEVRTYVRSYCGPKSFKVEWINDSSLNLSYFKPQDAEDAYSKLVLNPALGDANLTDLVLARPLAIGDKRANIMVRFAFHTDVKKRGARQNSRYYLINGEPTKEDDFVRYGASVRQPTRIDQDNLDDDDLFSHRAAPKAGLGSVADDLTSDLFPGKVALNRQERLRETAGDNNQEDEDRDIFNSLPKGPDSYRSRDRYDHERTRRNNTYGRTDRHDKWTKNSDLAARIDRGNRRFPSREDQDEAHNGEPQAPWRDSQRGGGRRHRRNNNNSSNNDQPFRSRSRSNSYSPERRNHHNPRRGNNHHRSHANREERDLGARFDEDRRSGRAWDNRDRD